MTSSVQPTSDAESPAPPQVPRVRRFKTARVLFALIMREMASTDSRTSLGFLWAIIEPIATIAILSVAFQLMTRTPPLGTNFPLFYVTGMMPYTIFMSIGNKVSSSIRFSKPLLGFPSVTALDTIMARFILNYLLTIAIFVAVTYGIILIYGLKVSINYYAAALSLGLSGMLALGVGTFNSVLFVLIPTYENLWSILTRPLMILSGVLFLIDELPEKYSYYLLWNPVAHAVGQMHAAFYPSFDSSFVSPFYVICVSVVCFTIGLVTLHRIVRDALDS